MFRHKENRRSGKKKFSRTAGSTHKKNLQAGPMRGGIRL